MKYSLHRASVGNQSGVVRPADGQEPGTWTWDFNGKLIAIDAPRDFAVAVEPGVEVHIDFGRFVLIAVRTAEGLIQYQASATGTTGPAKTDVERALWALMAVLPGGPPQCCFFCRWSDVEPSTDWGNMRCFVSQKTEYDEIAICSDWRRRKWVSAKLPSVAVDEWHGCDQYEQRPLNYGYRG